MLITSARTKGSDNSYRDGGPEGGRQSFKDQAHFIELSYGSLMEVMSQLDLALDLGFITIESHERLEILIDEEARVLSGYRASLLSKKA